MRRCAPAWRSTPNVGRNDFDFENTTHFACSQQPHLTFDCTCPVASARRCGLLIWLWHRPNLIDCCELLILHRPCTGGAVLVKTSERMRLTEGHEGHASWKEPGHSYRSNSSYRKLPPPACPGTTTSSSSSSGSSSSRRSSSSSTIVLVVVVVVVVVLVLVVVLVRSARPL